MSFAFGAWAETTFYLNGDSCYMNNLSKILIAAAVFATAGLAFAQTDRNSSGSNNPSNISTPEARDRELRDGVSRDRDVRATPDVSTHRDSQFNRRADRMNSRDRVLPNELHMNSSPVD